MIRARDSEAPVPESAPAMPRPRYPWWMAPAAWCGAWLIRLLGHSWRIRRLRMDEFEGRVAGGQRCIYAFWHARLLPLVFTHRGRGIVVLVSRHRDGELITRIVEHLGFLAARGSSTRGGEEGLRDMIEWAERGQLLAISPDGPRGPAEVLKPGLVYLASRTGFPIVPVAAAGSPSWKLGSWDGFRIPKPFARLVAAYGEPIVVPAELSRDEFESRRLEVESAMVALTREVDALAGAGA